MRRAYEYGRSARRGQTRERPIFLVAGGREAGYFEAVGVEGFDLGGVVWTVEGQDWRAGWSGLGFGGIWHYHCHVFVGDGGFFVIKLLRAGLELEEHEAMFLSEDMMFWPHDVGRTWGILLAQLMTC